MTATRGAHTAVAGLVREIGRSCLHVFPVVLALLAALVPQAPAGAQETAPIDYGSQVQPILDSHCGGAMCHLGDVTSGVSLVSYEAVMASVGAAYGRAIVEPGNAAASPLWLKISSESPEFGARMPRGLPPLEDELQEIIRRWIDEGAREFAVVYRRGDLDASGRIEITDAIKILGFLFLGDAPPPCQPVGDANGDGTINLSDAIAVLSFLFLGGPPPPELDATEQAECNHRNTAPEVEPIGTVTGREGIPLEFDIFAFDADDDSLEYRLLAGPGGMSIEPATGKCRWTPDFGTAGDYFVRVQVTDDGFPPLSAETTGRVRIAPGNHPPSVTAPEVIYGRELVLVHFTLETEDVEGDTLAFEALEAPDGLVLDPAEGTVVWTPAPGQAGEYTLRVRVADDGTPSRSTTVETRLVIVSSDSPVNQPPVLAPAPVYRSYTGLEIRRPIGAVDPDGDTLAYEIEDLPDGARFDPAGATIVWTPAPDQVGPFYVPVRVTDDGIPPQTVEEVLVFKILPEDPCVSLDCDPATGCQATVQSLDKFCCAGEPEVRVAEPVADCPGGRVLFLGRNRRGFGRMQNCDRLRLILFAQGGANISVHLEARCVNVEEPVLVSIELTAESGVLVDEEFRVQLQVRNDGFAQALGMFLTVDPFAPLVDLDGREAILRARLVDADGTVLREELRVVLSLSALDDLPDPDVEDIPAGEVGCVGCHRPLGPTGERKGIEDAHPWYPLTCTDCHGGDATAVTREQAHVRPGDFEPAYLRDLTSDRLDQISEEYLRFVNPGDLRVASAGCGDQNPASGGTGCHQRIVESTPLSVMSTYAGHYSLPRFLAGGQTRGALMAAVDVRDEDFDPAAAPEGAVESLAALREPAPGADRSSLATGMDIYIPKSCPTCHLSDFGRNNARGNYRSSGCTACHMLYDDDGLSRSADPMISKDFPSHPIRHQLTTAIPTEQCTHCHFQGGRIGLAFQGIREGGFSPEKTPPDGVTLGVPLHAHDRDYYFSDEDATNDVDETPPDLHFAAGMDCADCHVGGDVHGDGNLYASERYQTGIRCEDCHGTVRAEISEDPADGLFKNSKGFPLRHLRRTEDDRILLTTHRTGKELEIPQIHRVLASGMNHAMTEAMGVDENGFSHAEKLECYACHTSWRQTCFGCHITIDDSGEQTNQTTGDVTQGAISVIRDDYSLDFFALGMNQRGRITPLCSSMSIFMSYRDEDRQMRYTEQVRTSSDGRRGFGWNPFHHHTVSRVPQNCDRCHPVAPGAGPDNSATLSETYGFGNGLYTFTDGDGVTHDLSAFLDPDGELIGEFPHPDTGPLPAAVRERALSIEVVPHPRNR